MTPKLPPYYGKLGQTVRNSSRRREEKTLLMQERYQLCETHRLHLLLTLILLPKTPVVNEPIVLKNPVPLLKTIR